MLGAIGRGAVRGGLMGMAGGAAMGGIGGAIGDDSTFLGGALRGAMVGGGIGAGLGAGINYGISRAFGQVPPISQSVRAGAASVVGRARASKAARRAGTATSAPAARTAPAGRPVRQHGGGFGMPRTRMLGPGSGVSGPVTRSNRRRGIPMGAGTQRGTGVTRMPSNQGIPQLERLAHRKQALGTLDRLATMMAPRGAIASNKGPTVHPGRAQLRRLSKKLGSNTPVRKAPTANTGKSFTSSLTNDAYGYGYLQNVRRRRRLI